MLNLLKILFKLCLWLLGALVIVAAIFALVVTVRYRAWGPDPVNQLYGKRTVLNLGHRGAPEAAPENTLPAFQAALELGAHGVELDVLLSGDGEIVVIHDYTLDKTTNGRGPVGGYTLEQLKQLDAGSWFSAEFTGVRMPTLREVFETLDRKVPLNIEIKSESFGTDGLEAAVAGFIAAHDLYDRVIVSSFNPVSLIRVKAADKRITVGLLYAPDLPRFLSEGWFIPLLLPEALHPRFDMVDEEYMAWARQKGFRVNAWTVNEATEMERLLDMGVDGMITDHPELLQQILRQRGLE